MTQVKATLDRIEGDYAVLLVRDDEVLRMEVPAALLPRGSREGDILDVSISKDEAATEDARKRVSDLIERLKKRG